MRYSKFIIKNYKGIKDLTVDLEKEPKSKVLTLVGLNESGKTSILEAITLFKKDIPDEECHKLIPKEKKLNFNGSVSIKAFLKLDHQDEKAIRDFAKSIGIHSLDGVKRIEIEKVKVFKNSVFVIEESDPIWELELKGIKEDSKKKRSIKSDSVEWIKITDFIENNLIPPIIYYPDFLFSFPARIYLEKYPPETGEQGTYREVISDILDSIGGGLNIQEHLLERMKSTKDDAKEALESTINKMSAKVSKTVFQAWETLFQSKGKEIVLKPDTEQGAEKRYYLEVRLKEGSNHYQIAERSLGFKWFFTFLLFTEFRKMRSTNEGEILFLLDEPASNLHSTAQKNLLKTFEKLVDKSRLIYTTHSHHLINPDWLSGAFIIRNKNLDYDDEINFDSEKTDIEAIPYKQFASQNPEQRTYFQPILDALDYQPGLLEEVPEIIITEGKNDYYTLRYINEVILRENNTPLYFYPGTGADRNKQVIALYLAWNRDFKILLDGDVHGNEAKQRYIEEFNGVVKNKITTYSDIDSAFNYSTEFLFTEQERIQITKKFDETVTDYNKSKFNTAIQILFLQKEKVDLSDQTVLKFKKIFATLQK